MSKAMIITVGTGRDGQDIAHGICCSIERENPDKVVFLVTPGSEEKAMPYIYPEIAEKKYELVHIRDENNIEQIFSAGLLSIDGLKKENFKLIVADYTSGTKPMSAALCMAAVASGLDTLSYVTGERGQDGRVMPGTEKPVSFKPLRILADRKLRLYIDLFNAWQFEACLKLLLDLKGMSLREDYQEKLKVLEELSGCYSSWDKFDVKTAFERLKKIKDNDLLVDLGAMNTIKENLHALAKEKDGELSPFFLADLLQNAQRRAQEGKYDDALARLYRLLEYSAQVILSREFGIDTGNVEEKNVPASLWQKYASGKNQKGAVVLSLYKAYDLLNDLKHPAGKRFLNDQEIKQVLLERNLSILAHGFHSISKSSFEKALQLVRHYALQAGRELNEMEKMTIFPRLSPNYRFFL